MPYFGRLATMTSEDRRILDLFAVRVRALAPSAAIWAFGSRARASAHPESDFDLCLVVPEVTRELRDGIYAIAWEIGFDEGHAGAHRSLRGGLRAGAAVGEHAGGQYSPRRHSGVTNAEKIQALVRYRLEQATEAIAAAELNPANGLDANPPREP